MIKSKHKGILLYELVGISFLGWNLVVSGRSVADIIIWLIQVILLFKSIKNLNNNVDITKQLNLFINTANIEKVQNNNLKTHISNVTRNYVDVDIEFSEENVHKLTMNGLQPIISNTFTALGVLGTFIGLTTGLGSLGGTTDDIIKNIDKLIPGITTAFTTSIIGLALSTMYNFVFRLVQIELYTNIEQLKVKYGKIDVQNTDDLNGLAEVLNKFCQQSVSLIDAINEKALAAEDRIVSAEKHLADQLSNFESITREKLKEYFETTVKINNKHIEDTVKEFEFRQKKLVEGIKTQHEDSLKLLVNLYKIHDDEFEKQCENFFNSLEEDTEYLKGVVRQEFSEGIGKIEDTNNKNIEQLKELFVINHKELEKWVGIIAQHQELLRESQSNIEAQQSLLSEKQETVNTNIDRLIESEENILSSMVEVSKNIDEAYEKVSYAYKDLNEATGKMKDSDEKLVGTVGILDSTIQKLSENTTDLKQALAESTETVKTNLITICETMNKSTEMCKTTSETIEKQIDAINEQTNEVKIQSGLISKQQEMVSDYITKMTDSTTQITESFTIGNEAFSKNISNTIEKVEQKLNDSYSNVERVVDLVSSGITKMETSTYQVIKEMQDTTRQTGDIVVSVTNINKQALEESLNKTETSIKDSNKELCTTIKDNINILKSGITTDMHQLYKDLEDAFELIDNRLKDNTSKLSSEMDTKITRIIEQTADGLSQLKKASENQVESNIRKIVDQEVRSIEEILKTIEALSKQIQKYNSTVRENEIKSNKIMDNIETSRLNAEILNKDLASINTYLSKLDNLIEKLNKEVKEDETE